MAATPLVAQRSDIEAFVEALFRYADENTYVQLRAFRDDLKDNAWHPAEWPAVKINGAGLDGVIEEAFRFAQRCANAAEPVVFAPPVVTLNSSREAAEKNIANGIAISVECDHEAQAARGVLEALLGRPTVVVASGGEWVSKKTGEVSPRLHLHWRLTEPTREFRDHVMLKEARRLAQRIAGADGSAVPLVHPLRWPGSWHRKATPKLARILELNEDAEIELRDAFTRLREVAEVGGITNATGPRTAGDPTADIFDVFSALAEIPNNFSPTERWDAWTKIGLAICAATGGSDAGFDAFDAWSRKHPSYDPAYTRERWAHIVGHPPNRIGAGTLFHLAAEAKAGWRKPSARGNGNDTQKTEWTAKKTASQNIFDAPLNDLGNAERLIERHGTGLRFVTGAGWFVWDGRRYRHDPEIVSAQELALDTARAMLTSAFDLPSDTPEQKERKTALLKFALGTGNTSKTSAMLYQARPACATEMDLLDDKPWLFNCANGTLDMRTGTLKPHCQSDILTKISPVMFDNEAVSPRWYKFVSEIFGGDNEMVEFLQRSLGYSMTGLTNEQVIFIMHGAGSNGKSVLIEIVTAILAEYASQSPSETFSEKSKHSSGIPNDIARLAGTRFVSVVETEQDKKLAESLVKQASGGDKMTARFLNREFFEFTPKFKLWLATNHKPVIRGTGNAMWRRIRLLPFLVTFADPDEATEGQPIRDRNLKDALLAELPGILNWMIAGCLAWQRDGLLKAPKAVTEATSEYRTSQDTTGGFVDECCHVSPGLNVKFGKLYAAYKNWCLENGEAQMTATAFGLALDEKGFYMRQLSKGVRYRIGLDLKENVSNSTES